MESKDINLLEIWMPSIESIEKVVGIGIEKFINMKPRQSEFSTILELLINCKGNFDKMISNCGIENIEGNKFFKNNLKKILGGKLENEYTYKAVFLKSGGLLNIFNPRIKESEDDLLNELKLKYEDKHAIEIWLNTKSEFFSGLSPKLTWAGAGELELDLMHLFLEELKVLIKGKKYQTYGECLGLSMQQLRAWVFVENKICNHQKPIYAIIAERQENFEKKLAILKKYNIKNDFG